MKSTDPNRVNKTQFAARIGVSKPAVSRMVKVGRVIVGKDGLIDWSTESERCKSSVINVAHVALKAKKAQNPVKVAKIAEETTKKVEKNQRVAPKKQSKPVKKQIEPVVISHEVDENFDEQLEFPQDSARNTKQIELNDRLLEAKAEKAEYDSALARIKLDEQRGLVVNAEEVKSIWSKHITAAKTKIMSIPSECKSRYSEIPLGAVDLIQRICREALNGLANGAD